MSFWRFLVCGGFLGVFGGLWVWGRGGYRRWVSFGRNVGSSFLISCGVWSGPSAQRGSVVLWLLEWSYRLSVQWSPLWVMSSLKCDRWSVSWLGLSVLMVQLSPVFLSMIFLISLESGRGLLMLCVVLVYGVFKGWWVMGSLECVGTF